jgi:hypothetical protein
MAVEVYAVLMIEVRVQAYLIVNKISKVSRSLSAENLIGQSGYFKNEFVLICDRKPVEMRE